MSYFNLLPREIYNYTFKLYQMNNPNNQFVFSLHLVKHYYLPKTRLERFFRKHNWKVLVDRNRLIIFDLPIISNHKLVKFLLKLNSNDKEINLINQYLENYNIKYQLISTGVMKI